MKLEEILKDLVDFDSEGSPVVSLYLNVDPTQRTTDEYKLVLRRLLDSKDGEIPKEDRQRIEHFILYEFDWHGKGVACFSCHAKGLWRAVSLQVPVDDLIFVEQAPYVRPLTDLMDIYDRLGVLNFDSESARLLVFYLGDLEAADGIIGQEVKKHKQGGWSAPRYQRHMEALALQNMKATAEMVDKYYREGAFKRLVLSGTEENISLLEGLLPKNIKEIIAGEIHLPIEAPLNQVQEEALKVALEASKREKEALAKEAIDRAESGGAGVVGLGDTLGALQEERVYTLLISEDFKQPIWQCVDCGYMVDQELKECPVCKGHMKMEPEGAHPIVKKALEQGARIVVVPQESPLSEYGEIGALLRY
jgi:peptide chain release factor subunit 1